MPEQKGIKTTKSESWDNVQSRWLRCLDYFFCLMFSVSTKLRPTSKPFCRWDFYFHFPGIITFKNSTYYAEGIKRQSQETGSCNIRGNQFLIIVSHSHWQLIVISEVQHCAFWHVSLHLAVPVLDAPPRHRRDITGRLDPSDACMLLLRCQSWPTSSS